MTSIGIIGCDRSTSNWPGATLPFAKATQVLEPTASRWP